MTTNEGDKSAEKPPSPSTLGALAALRRATVKARARAFSTTGAVAVFRDGKVVWELPDGTFVDNLEDVDNQP